MNEPAPHPNQDLSGINDAFKDFFYQTDANVPVPVTSGPYQPPKYNRTMPSPNLPPPYIHDPGHYNLAVRQWIERIFCKWSLTRGVTFEFMERRCDLLQGKLDRTPKIENYSVMDSIYLDNLAAAVEAELPLPPIP